MKKKVIAIISILILACVTILTFTTKSEGFTQYQNGLTWYYEVVDGEAVNVYVYSGTPSTTVTIPTKLGGYPVTSIIGEKFGYTQYNIFGKNNSSYNYSGKVEKIIIPDTVNTIGNYAFLNCYSLKDAKFPQELEIIGTAAFQNCAIESVSIPDNVTKVGERAFYNCSKLKTINIGDSLISIDSSTFAGCINATNVKIPNTVKTIYYDSFAGVKDVFVDNTKENLEILNPNNYNVSKMPNMHYKNCNHNINLNVLQGIKIINEANGEQITNNDFECGENITFRLEKDANYNYDNMAVFIESKGDYLDSENTVQKINLNFGDTYTLNNLLRDKTIYVQEQKDGFDLSLRQYIYSINNKEISNSREPKVKIVNGKIQYQHSKNVVYPQKGDKIVYNIRVYNEGTIAGTANKITEYLPEGLDFNGNSAINIKYGWKVSEDGRSVTTEFLKPLSINPYTGVYGLSYQEISIECIVNTDKTDELKRFVNIAQIAEGSGEDIDSIPGNITGPVDSDYMKEESQNSDENSYIVGTEDDNDFESIIVSNNMPVKYSFRINKIDEIDNELLNGATFELLDSNKKVIKTGVTANGGILDFGIMETKGEKQETYYVREVHTPEGYKNTIKYLIQVDVISKVVDATKFTTKIECDVQDIDVDTSKYKTIEINTKNDLLNIQNNQTKKYILKQDIDLQGEDWTPLNVSNVMIDGNGHKITNLKIDTNDQTTKKFGLFGTYSGIIENLTLENVDINVTKYVDENADNTDTKEETEEDIDAVGSIIGYSENAILKNCKVTGKVNSTLRNVGGLVGHTKSKTILVLRDCINESTITATSHNIGGFLGCGLGPVKVNNCINKGSINAKSYNAAGIVGYARPEGYEVQRIFANYDNINEFVSLAIKNERTTGEYNVELSKTDFENSGLLNGARFKVLNREKQVINGYENIDVQNGKLNFGLTKIDTTGTDIYYIKEVQAPVGYKDISNNYIKLNIIKKWNKEEEKYYVEATVNVISEDEFNSIQVGSLDTSSSKTGKVYNEGNTSNITWNINEIQIVKSVNEGIITNNYEYTNTAGILGMGKGRTLIYECSNTGKISSQSQNVRASGIVAAIDKNTDNDIAIVEKCNNLNEIEGTSQNNEGLVSGVLSYSRIKLNLNECNNQSSITGNYATCSGILSGAVGTIEISNCNNTGDITSTMPAGSNSIEAAGIIAKNYWVDYIDGQVIKCGTTKIDNCVNTGNISGTSHVSGIIAQTNAYRLDITNSNANNCNLTINEGGNYNSLGGIVGDACTEYVTLKNCKIENVNINNSSNNGSNMQTAGIIASINRYGTRTINESQYIYINDCNVVDSTVNAKYNNAAGIIAFGGYGYSNEVYNEINNCNVSNSSIITENYAGNGTAVSGIYGQGYEIKQVYITECNVTESTVEFKNQSSGSYINVAGIFGMGYNSNDVDTLIRNVQVISSKIYNNGIQSSSYGINTAGILAENYVYSKGTVNIINAKVYDSEINANYGNVGGIYNAIQSNAREECSSLIDNCVVEKTTINSENGSGYNDSMGGIAGATNLNTTFNNCKVVDSTITNNKARNTGGIVRIYI
jgi:uncharacterized repeat protein (TIGR01451 family)